MRVEQTIDLDHGLRLLVKLGASQINGGAHCIDMHWTEARAHGESELRLAQLAAWSESPYFDERERAALTLTDAVTNVAATHVPTGKVQMNMPPIVSPPEWEAARQELLVKEKELTRARDALAAERRRMPRVAVEKPYRFEGRDGAASLLDPFEGRRQLIVYRFFFEPGVHGWPEHGCGGCSFLADQVAHLAHLNARDTTLAFVSRAPQPEIERWRARMGWEIPWYTLTDDFDADFGVDEWHGTNAFLRDGDEIWRTYFVNNRGDEAMGAPGATST